MKFLWPWLAATLLVLPARAESLRVDDLSLRPDPAWQRGEPRQEQEDDALALSRTLPDGGALRVLVPRSPPLLKSDAETFYRNLTRKWYALYGQTATVGWTELGGRRWLRCRRPSRVGDGEVFQLATVHEGRAYTVVAMAPAGTDALPGAVGDLLAGAEFSAPAQSWRQTRGLAVMPRGEALDALAQAEADVLGGKGMLLGHELAGDTPAGGGQAVRWSLDGFLWDQAQGRDGRRPIELRGRLAARAPADQDGGGLTLDLALEAGGAPLAVRATRQAYCGPEGAWRTALAALDRGAPAGLARLARDHPCAGEAGPGVLAEVEIVPGQVVSRTVALPPPPDQATAWWVEVRLVPQAGSLGEMLLGRTGVYFVYEPQSR